MPDDLKVTGVTVRFGGLVAADNVSFEVQPGEIVGLIGPNGAGKTTVIGVLSGTVLPVSGKVELGGRDLTYRRPYEIARAGLTRSFQQSSIFATLSVEDNLLVASQHAQSDPAAFIDDVLTRLGMQGRRGVPAGELSYGEMRRLAISMAVATKPRVLLLDEPAAGLNDVESVNLGELMTWTARQTGCGILLVEHDMQLVMSVSQRILVLDHGVLIAKGTPDEIRRHPDVIRVYLGTEVSDE